MSIQPKLSMNHFMSWFSATAGMLVVTMLIIQMGWSLLRQRSSDTMVQSPNPALSAAEFGDLQQQVYLMRRTLTAMQNGDRGGAPDVRGLAVRVQAIEQHQHDLERIILQDPDKALQMPLFQRDLQNERDSRVREMASMTQSVDHVYSLSQWLIGGIVLILLGPAMTSLWRRRTDNPPEPEKLN